MCFDANDMTSSAWSWIFFSFRCLVNHHRKYVDRIHCQHSCRSSNIVASHSARFSNAFASLFFILRMHFTSHFQIKQQHDVRTHTFLPCFTFFCCLQSQFQSLHLVFRKEEKESFSLKMPTHSGMDYDPYSNQSVYGDLVAARQTRFK